MSDGEARTLQDLRGGVLKLLQALSSTQGVQHFGNGCQKCGGTGANCPNLVAIEALAVPLRVERCSGMIATPRLWELRGRISNEQQTDEVGDSRFSVALYSRSGSRRF